MALLPATQIGDNPQIPGSFADTYIPDQLIAGHFNLVTTNVTLTAGAIYPRGLPIGIITASGLAVSSKATATDGSQNPVGILAVYTDLTAATGPQGAVNGNAGIYQTGEFNANTVASVMDASWTIATLQAAFGARSIFLKNPVTATDPS